MKRIIKKIISLLLLAFPKLGLGFRICRFIKYSWDTNDYNGVPFSKDATDSMNTFLTEEEKKDNVLIEKIKRDMVRCYLLYGITPDEYFLHDCRHASESYKESILSRYHKDKIVIKVTKRDYNRRNTIAELKDKWTFYTMAKDYFKRDVCRVDEKSNLSEIESFCKKHNRFIAKPRFASCGIGVHIVDLQQVNCVHGGGKELCEYYKQLGDGKWLFEEIIVQDPAMAAWHESSVNTIRIPSIKTKHGCKVLLPLFRTGKNGNVVDNCHNDGGLMSVPDADTGILVSDGYDVFTNVVEKHPNSGLKFKGWQVPRWDELLKVSSELHQTLPEYHKYVGFDFALTSKGWVVIEGNWGNFPHQVCVHRGIKREFIQLMNS